MRVLDGAQTMDGPRSCPQQRAEPPGLGCFALDMGRVAARSCLWLPPLSFHPCPAVVKTLIGKQRWLPAPVHGAPFSGRDLTFFVLFCPALQYYEMSYGLNIEMHKQVGEGISKCFNSWGGWAVCRALSPSLQWYFRNWKCHEPVKCQSCFWDCQLLGGRGHFTFFPLELKNMFSFWEGN